MEVPVRELEQWLGRSLSPTLVYDHPTIEALAAKVSGDRAGRLPVEAEEESHDPGAGTPIRRPTRLAYALCGAAQAVGLYFILGFFSLQWHKDNRHFW